MDFYNKNVLICGVARSGISALLLLKKLGANVTIQDLKEKHKIDNIEVLKDNNISLYLGKNPEYQLIDKIDIMVVSPGVPLDLDFVKYAISKIPVISEIELSYLICKAPILAITGTNGKTTTTSIVGNILKNYKTTFVAGNIGIPFSEKVLSLSEDDVVVLELSSFQLEAVKEFRPIVASVLNITEDHLNRHKTMENYIKAKERIFENQTEDDFLILNYDDVECRKMAQTAKSSVMYFSICEQLECGAYLKDNYIYIDNEKFININELKILGTHNMQNVMASILMCLSYNVPDTIIKDALKNFTAVEHRIEYIATKRGVDYYNDSKGTNIDATLKAVDTMTKPIYIIIGGYEKGTNFSPMLEKFGDKVKQIVVIGQVKNRIADSCENLGLKNYSLKDTLEDAIEFCYENARDGECVLLSPACASFDMFKDYEERGNIFKQYVANLKE